jgi:hypothetical protein
LTQKSFSVMPPNLLQAGNSLTSQRGGVIIQTIPALKSHALQHFHCSCKQKQCLHFRVCANNPKDISALSRTYFSVSLLLLQAEIPLIHRSTREPSSDNPLIHESISSTSPKLLQAVVLVLSRSSRSNLTDNPWFHESFSSPHPISLQAEIVSVIQSMCQQPEGYQRTQRTVLFCVFNTPASRNTSDTSKYTE